MNECTIHGNATADPVRHQFDNGGVAVSFDVAVNIGYFDRRRNEYVSQSPVFHRVVCFDDLAENVAATVRKGMALSITGRFRDDSYTNAENVRIRRIRLGANDVAVSLRWATAEVTRRSAGAAAEEFAEEREQAAQAIPA